MSRFRRIATGAVVAVTVAVSCSGGSSLDPPPAPSGALSTEPVDDGARWDEFVARVQTPIGPLGPRTGQPVDPREVDQISWTGTGWRMDRDWDELVDGGFLDLGAASLELNGHTVLGFRIEVPSGIESGHVIDGPGTAGFFRVTNPNRFPNNSSLRGLDLAYSYHLSGVVGDAIKVGEGSSAHRDAVIEMDVAPGGPDDKHYDGVQVFKSGSARLERMVIDWNSAGTIAATTAAVFTQDGASLTARDIVVIDPGGTWQPIRLQGSGVHDVDRIQVVGSREPNVNQPDRLAPTAIVRLGPGLARFELFNDVAGADDWTMPDP